ncbi:MAG: rhodanese-like domain-containing protein [Chromatiales bacterium]|jgi:rhodanese-related sulfurtransferase
MKNTGSKKFAIVRTPRLSSVLALLSLLAFPASAETIKGRIKYISNKANTIQIDVKGKPSAVVRFDGNTVFENVSGIKELSPPDLIKVETETGNPASKISKIVFGLPAGMEININELLAILQKKQGPYLLGDARPSKKYLRAHIPSAISMPVADEQKFMQMLPQDKQQLLVFYCGGPTCPFTAKAIKAASAAGYSNLKGFQAGIPGWKKAKLPVHTNPVWLSKRLDQHHVVIDVRDVTTANSQHIAGAVSLTTAQLVGMTNHFLDTQKNPQLPGLSDKRAPIFLYDDSHTSRNVLLAFRELRNWGYGNVSILEGGLQNWLAQKLPTVSNQLASNIHYVKKLAKGAIAPEEFLARSKTPGDATFLDVRTEAELVKNGALKGSLHIPLDSLEDKLAKLPRDKEILVYCENGIRAEMAYETLSKNGFNARFLNETTEFDNQGNLKL